MSSSYTKPDFVFKGDDFKSFQFRMKLILKEQKVDVLALTEDVTKRIQLAQATVSRGASDQISAEERVAAVQLLDQWNESNTKATSLIVKHLSPQVLDVMCKTLPEEKQHDTAAIWEHLRSTYDVRPSTHKAIYNPEKLFLQLLRTKFEPHKTNATVYLRTMNTTMQSILASRKYAKSTSLKKGLKAIMMRHALDEVGAYSRYRHVYDDHLPSIIDQDDPDIILDNDAWEEFRADVEIEDTNPLVKNAAAAAAGGKSVSKHFSPPGAGAAAGVGAGASKPFRPQGGSGASVSQHSRSSRGPGKPGGAKVNQTTLGGSPVFGVSDMEEVNDEPYLSTLSTPSTVSSLKIDVKHQTIFLVDSGATHHCVRQRSLFSTFRPGKHIVHVANNKTIAATGKGEVVVQVQDKDGIAMQLTLNDVYFVPSLTNNIFSTNRFLRSNPTHQVTMGPGDAKLLRAATHQIPLTTEHGLVWMLANRQRKKPGAGKTTTGVPSPNVQSAPTMSMQLFHERMAHVNIKDCKALAAEQGIKLTNTDKEVCPICQSGKQRKQPMPALAVRAPVAPGEILHCDIKGPLDSSYNRAKYALVVVDEATRICMAREMKSKDNVVDALRSVISSFARYPGKRIVIGEKTILHSDSEAVLKSKGMSDLLAAHRMTARASPPHTHERNGIVERAIQTLFDTVRVLLLQGNLDDKFWPVALQHAVYVRNRSPTQALGGRTPLRELTGKSAPLDKLRKFGCKVYVKVDDSSRRALDPKSRVGIYVGNSDLSDSYRVMVSNATRWDIVETVHCTFDESVLGITKSPAAPVAAAAPSAPPKKSPQLLAERDPLLDDFSDDEDAAVSALVVGGGSASLNYRQAMQSAESASWATAVKSEIESLTGNGTFEVVPESSVGSGKLLSTQWVLTKKRELNGDTRFKGRLVALGNHQRAGLDFNQVYSPVVNAGTVRAMLAIAAINDCDLDQMDAVTAFLNAPLEEEIFLRIPNGFQVQQGHVLRLKKALYGLKQAPRSWNKMLQEWLISYGLQQSTADPCLYFLPGQLWVAFWVDDFLVMAPDADVKNKFKNAISEKFKMRDLGPVNQFLGMTISRDRSKRTLTLQSAKHIDDMLDRFQMNDAKPYPTPLPHKNAMVPCVDDEDRLPPQCPYRAVVGSLLYVAMWTRPDIAFAVSQVARFQQNPSNHHWECAKHILRYLKGTRDVGLTFSAGQQSTAGPPVLLGYVDASWGEDPSTRKSQTGFVFTLGNAAVAWKSKLQDTVALSSTEAEYLALSPAVKEALHLRNLLHDLCPAISKTAPVTLYEDNQSTIKLASNLQSSERTKHVDIRHHFLKDHVANGDITLVHIPTSDQPADALTKNLDRIKIKNSQNPHLQP